MYVYIIRCEGDFLYSGIAVDLEERMRDHYTKNKRCAKFTKAHPIISLEAAWEVSAGDKTLDKSYAARLEYWLKRLNHAAKYALIACNSDRNEKGYDECLYELLNQSMPEKSDREFIKSMARLTDVEIREIFSRVIL